MIQGKAILVVDMGNSSTKCKVKFGKDATTGKYRERDFELSNSFSFIDSGYEVSSDYNDDTSTILDVDTVVNERELKGHVCNGELQLKEFPLRAMKPTANQKKYESRETALSIRLAFLRAYRELLAMNRQTDISQVHVTWDVITLLPPGDIAVGADKMKSLIKNVTRITSVFPVVDVEVNIQNIAVLPEGFCAYAGTVYDNGMVIRPDYKFLTEETIIVFDIGAGTTDCLIIRDNKLIQNSKYTVNYGGNNVFANVKKAVQLKGLDIDEEDLRKGIIHGYVKDGAKKISIVDDVNSAKRVVAENIIHDFQVHLDTLDIKTRSIGYVLVCGGGSMQDSDCTDIIPLSKQIVDNFKLYSPNCELIEIPTHVVSKEGEDGTATRVEEKISPRELNLIGASILAEKIAV